MAAELYYSYYRNRAAVSVTEEGRKKKYFYNYDSDEIYQTDSKCHPWRVSFFLHTGSLDTTACLVKILADDSLRYYVFLIYPENRL